nr:hypothetical protein [Pedobacter panaciterrae]
MAKHILLSYEADPNTVHNAVGLIYILKIQRITWWGLRKRIIEHHALIPLHSDSQKYFDAWDADIGKEIK